MTDPYRPPEAPEPEVPPFTTGRALLWILSAFLVMLSSAIAYFVIDPDATSDLVGLGILSSASFLFVSALLVGRYPGGPRLGQPLGIRPTHPAAILVGFLIGVTAKVPAEQLSLWVHQLAPRAPEEEAAYEAMFQAESPLHALAILLSIAVLVPFAEEVFFRGAIYGAMRRNQVSEGRAAWTAAIGFALCHADARQLLPIFLVAGMLGTLRTFSGSLLPSVAAHVGFNGVAVIGATYELMPELEKIPVPARVAATVACAGLLAFVVRVVGKHPAARQARQVETTIEPEETADAV